VTWQLARVIVVRQKHLEQRTRPRKEERQKNAD
jgi:hypothetical protein